jgi:hypothetical protein
MKKRVFEMKSLLLLMLPLCMVSFSLSAQEAMKEFTEAYDVSKGVTLSSDTKYSDIELLTWEKNVVDIRAEVRVKADSKGRAEEKLSMIHVGIGKSGNTINLETELDEGWSKNAKVDIHIVVNAPAYLNLTVESAYGDLFIQELSGLLLLDLRYGNLKAGKLSRGDEKPYNKMDLSYSNGTVESAGCMELTLAYSDLEITRSDMLFVESKYSKLLGETAGGIITEGSYDKYTFDAVDSFEGELKYSGVKFESLNRKLNVESKYTPINIHHLSKDFKEVNMTTSYGNVSIEVEGGASFKIEGEAKYGTISVALDGKLSRQKENTSMTISGTVGSSPKGSMVLEARYGNIDIK